MEVGVKVKSVLQTNNAIFQHHQANDYFVWEILVNLMMIVSQYHAVSKVQYVLRIILSILDANKIGNVIQDFATLNIAFVITNLMENAQIQHMDIIVMDHNALHLMNAFHHCVINKTYAHKL